MCYQCRNHATGNKNFRGEYRRGQHHNHLTLSIRFQGKLIKLFSRLLVAKTKLPVRDDLKHIPSLTQWLQVVGLSKESIAGVCLKVSSLEELKEKSEHELRTILNEKNAKPEEFGRLHRALHNLRRYTGIIQNYINVTM